MVTVTTDITVECPHLSRHPAWSALVRPEAGKVADQGAAIRPGRAGLYLQGRHSGGAGPARRRQDAMTDHKVGNRQEWQGAPGELPRAGEEDTPPGGRTARPRPRRPPLARPEKKPRATPR